MCNNFCNKYASDKVLMDRHNFVFFSRDTKRESKLVTFVTVPLFPLFHGKIKSQDHQDDLLYEGLTYLSRMKRKHDGQKIARYTGSISSRLYATQTDNQPKQFSHYPIR